MVNSNIKRGFKRFKKLCHHQNDNLKICLARNLYHFYEEFPQKTIELMKYFLRKELNKNIRRTIAKDKSVEFLLSLMDKAEFKNQVIEIIWKLIQDNDTIITITTFDYIGKILQIDKELGLEIINFIIEKEKDDKLLERAKLWRYSIQF